MALAAAAIFAVSFFMIGEEEDYMKKAARLGSARRTGSSCMISSTQQRNTR